MTPAWLATYFAALLALLLPRPGPPDAEELAALATRLRIPMPPKDARLVLAYAGSATDTGPVYYTPAFLLEEKADGSAVVLRGFDRETVRPVRKGELAWRKFSLDPVDPKTAGYEVSFGLDAYVCAAQVAAREDVVTARGILKRFDPDGRWFGNEDLELVYRDPRLLLGELWVEHLLESIPEGPTSWRGVHDGLKVVFEELPFFATRDLRKLVDDLATTLRAKPPAVGSTEALMLDWATRPAVAWGLGSRVFDGQEANAPARAVVARGFDAIPDLLALLDDRRLTTHQSPPFNRIPASNLRVSDLAWALLREVTGADLTPADDQTVAEVWRAWWAKARARSEREYYLGAVFEVKDGKVVGVQAGPAHVLGQKFPDALPGLCAEFTERAAPDAYPFELAQAVATTQLPKAERVKALASFAGRGTLTHRRSVLQVLADLDGAECARILLSLVEKLPRDTDGRYWASPEAGLGYVVAKLEDDAVWRAYLAATRRASVGLRMEMLNSVCDSRPGAKNRERRLAFLAALLDDETVRDATADPKKFDGAAGTFMFPRLSVRDFAAWSIAGMLGVKDRPDQSWDADKWAELRRKVRGELAREKLPDLAPAR